MPQSQAAPNGTKSKRKWTEIKACKLNKQMDEKTPRGKKHKATQNKINTKTIALERSIA